MPNNEPISPLINPETVIGEEIYDWKPTQAFLDLYFKINNSIRLQFIEHSDWREKKRQGKILDTVDGQLILFISLDLKLWEIVSLVKEIDKETFNDHELLKQGELEIQNLGKYLEIISLYLSHHLLKIPNSDRLETLANELHKYGLKLQNKTQANKDIAGKLTPKQLELGDQFWLQTNGAPNLKNISPQQRIKKIKNIAQALEKKASQTLESGPIQTLIEQLEIKIINTIEQPRIALINAMFRRAMKELTFNKQTPDGEQTVYKALRVPTLKKKLDEIRKNENKKQIVKKELEIIELIEEQIHSFKFCSAQENDQVYRIHNLIKYSKINCLSASMLTSGLLAEIGIKHAVGILEGHIQLFIKTSSNEIYSYNFTPENPDPEKNDEYNLSGKITPDHLVKIQDTNQVVTVEDICNYIQKPQAKYLTFEIKEELDEPDEKAEQVFLYTPNLGLQIGLLNTLLWRHKHKEMKPSLALSICQSLMRLQADTAHFYTMGELFLKLKQPQKAIIYFEKFLRLWPQEANFEPEVKNEFINKAKIMIEQAKKMME